MGFYDSLIAKWSTFTPGTQDQKLAQINALAVQISSHGTLFVAPSQILNAIVSADFLSLTQLQVLQLSLLLSGTSIDVSKGSSIRTSIQTMFAGKTATLANLSLLVSEADKPVTISWWKATVDQGGGGLKEPVGRGDLINAGNLV